MEYTGESKSGLLFNKKDQLGLSDMTGTRITDPNAQQMNYSGLHLQNMNLNEMGTTSNNVTSYETQRSPHLKKLHIKKRSVIQNGLSKIADKNLHNPQSTQSIRLQNISKYNSLLKDLQSGNSPRYVKLNKLRKSFQNKLNMQFPYPYPSSLSPNNYQGLHTPLPPACPTTMSDPFGTNQFAFPQT